MIKEFVEQSLDFCIKKNPHLKSRRGVVDMLVREDNLVHSSFRYALSRRICEYLASYHQELEKIYLTGSTLEDRAGFTSDIDLIIKIRKKSKAVMATLRRLDSDIIIYYRSLLGRQAKKMHKILDPQFISLKEDLEKIEGRLFHPPLLIWKH